MTKTYDALIIGGGHNGLVCAFYLAKAGMRVRVLERRHIVGGAAVTEEFHPGFRNSTASYTVSLLRRRRCAAAQALALASPLWRDRTRRRGHCAPRR